MSYSTAYIKVLRYLSWLSLVPRHANAEADLLEGIFPGVKQVIPIKIVDNSFKAHRLKMKICKRVCQRYRMVQDSLQ